MVHAAPVTGLVVLAPLAAAGDPVPTAGALLGAADGVAGGWTAASYLRLPAPDRTPERVAAVPAGSPRRPAVVYVTHGEPETYEHSLHATPALIRKGARGTGLEVLDVGGWNTAPLLVELLADRTRQALAELEARADSQR